MREGEEIKKVKDTNLFLLDNSILLDNIHRTILSTQNYTESIKMHTRQNKDQSLSS